ncbi:MAG: T9SS type A sorting domain-containing protein [Chlorobi bacterium]|nr:T9SS type A sorting domain-containing protein [Chlorobiota bacterium]
MKTLNTLILMIMITISAQAQDVGLDWAKQFDGAEAGEAVSINVDVAGNVYVTGYFEGTFDFDPGDGTYELTATDISDVFVSKLNTDGGFVWAKNLGGAGHEEGFSMVVDNSGHVYSCGVFVSNTDFDPGDDFFILDGGDNGDPYVHKMKSILTGIESPGNSFVAEVGLYPNPNSGTFTVSGEDLQRTELYGIEGKLIETIELDAKSSCQVQLGSKTKGLFFAKIISGKGKSVIRIAVQ